MGYFENPESFSMVLQYAPHGDLLDFMVKLKQSNNNNKTDCHTDSSPTRFDMARIAVRQVCLALMYLESLQIAHRDVKPENLLVTAPTHVRLCDFGWAVWFRRVCNGA